MTHPALSNIPIWIGQDMIKYEFIFCCNKGNPIYCYNVLELLRHPSCHCLPFLIVMLRTRPIGLLESVTLFFNLVWIERDCKFYIAYGRFLWDNLINYM